MFWLATTIVAQAEALRPPQTGNPALDAIVWLGGALLTIISLREGREIVGKVKTWRNGGEHQGRDRVLERIAEIQRATLKELEESRRENDKAHERIEDQLAELRRKGE